MRLICVHMLEEKYPNPCAFFTGIGLNYHIICAACADDLSNLELKEAKEELFNDLSSEIEKAFGAPELKERASNLYFEHQKLDWLNFDKAQPVAFHARGQNWLLCLDSGLVIEIDSKNQKQMELFRFSDTELSLNEKLIMRVSADERYVALAHKEGSFGFVWDSINQKTNLSLNRGTYYVKQSVFPMAFCELDGETLIVHGTAWNRLDISQPATGEKLTGRSYPEYKKGERPEHYLDYFHAGLYVSPGSQWIAEYGWVWGPFGVAHVWSLQRWLKENIWESEDGRSLKKFGYVDYFWDSPMVWIDEKTLAVWGFGRDDYWMTDALSIYDVTTNAEPRLISAIKRGELVFDTYLFSMGKAGTEVWDIVTGERLHYDKEFMPKAYNPLSKEFLSYTPEAGIQISYLREA